MHPELPASTFSFATENRTVKTDVSVFSTQMLKKPTRHGTMLEVVLRAEHHQFKPFMLRVLRQEPRGVDGFFIGDHIC